MKDRVEYLVYYDPKLMKKSIEDIYEKAFVAPIYWTFIAIVVVLLFFTPWWGFYNEQHARNYCFLSMVIVVIGLAFGISRANTLRWRAEHYCATMQVEKLLNPDRIDPPPDSNPSLPPPPLHVPDDKKLIESDDDFGKEPVDPSLRSNP